MKAARIFLTLIFPILASAESPRPAQRTEPRLRELLQEGLFEEEANRNLDKASAAYEALVQSFDQDRQFAATAVFRLAEIRAKQNRKDDAIALYQRVATEFANVDPLARLSREHIAALGGKALDNTSAAAPTLDEEAKEIARLEDLVKNSPDLLNSAKEGVTPLGSAARKGWLKAVSFLLDHGADINAPRDGWPALHLAATDGRKAMVELLIRRGADLNQKDVNLRTPLQITADFSRIEVARVLLENGAKADVLSDWAQGKNGRSALHAACAKVDLAMVQLLLGKGADVNLVSLQSNPDYDGKPTGTPLMASVRTGNKELVALLLDHHADPKIEVGEQPKTSALHIAIKNSNGELATLLMQHGAKPIAPDLLWDATYDCNAEMVRLLIKNGADLNAAKPDTTGTAPLHLAVRRSKQITELLLEAGASVNVQDDNGWTPALWDLEGFRDLSPPAPRTRVLSSSLKEIGEPPKPEEILTLLAAKGADLNIRARDGRTAFHSLMRRETPLELIQWFLDHGADPTVKNSQGETPAMVAPLDRRIYLEERTLYLPWTKQQAIHAILRGSANSGEPRRFEPVAGFDLPPLLTDVTNTVRMDAVTPKKYYDAIVYRANSDGKLTEVYQQPVDDLPDVRLQWGDVVVVTGGDLASPGKRPKILLLEREAQGQVRKVKIQVGERQKEVQISNNVEVRGPAWYFSQWLEAVVEAEPRVQLDAIKVRRMIDGNLKEWSVDLRPTVQGSRVRELPARLDDGDLVVIPLRAASDPEALKARGSGIFRVASGRVYGDRIFSLSEKDNAPRTLGELIMEAYGGSRFVIPDPDFAHILIHRLKGDSGGEETIAIDFAAIMAQVTGRSSEADARKVDVPLNWGDVVEISTRKDSDLARWKALNAQTQNFLTKALSRRVAISTNGSVEPSGTLLASFVRFGHLTPPYDSFFSIEGGNPFRGFRPLAIGARYSADKVIRIRLRSGGTVREFTADEFNSVNPWLLDGDMIEVESY